MILVPRVRLIVIPPLNVDIPNSPASLNLRNSVNKSRNSENLRAKKQMILNKKWKRYLK